MSRGRLLNILWCAFFLGVIIYHLTYYYLRPAEAIEIVGERSFLSYALLLLGIFSALFLVNLDIFLLSRPRTIRISAGMLPPGAPESDEKEFLAIVKAQWFIPRFILALALAEVSGVLGLVVGFLGGNPPVASILFSLSYLMLIYLRLRLAMRWHRMYLS